jgi:tyrosyl-tRNA synthetase
MKLSEELDWRGFKNQTTITDLSHIDDEQLSFYLGADPSADSLTIGNLAAIMMVKRFIDHGHKAFLLIGGATGMIGDPDGKAEERKLQTLEAIDFNKKRIVSQYQDILGSDNIVVVDNYDWFRELNYLDFLKEIGKNVPMSQMLSRDFVKARLGEGGSGISYAEFSYSLIQGYDFLHLFREHGVSLQLCGADQWGNSITGVDLIRRIEGSEAHVYSTPLVINKSTGKKFGKSEDGAVWLASDRTSVYKFYQFWLNLDDEGAIDYIKIYTDLDKNQVDEIQQKHSENPGQRFAQKALARAVTQIVHGAPRTDSVEKVTSVLFGGNDISGLSAPEIELLSQEVPSYPIGRRLVEYMVESQLSSSIGDARRLIDGGAVSVNGVKISEDYTIDKLSLIKKGKNSFALVKA